MTLLHVLALTSGFLLLLCAVQMVLSRFPKVEAWFDRVLGGLDDDYETRWRL